MTQRIAQPSIPPATRFWKAFGWVAHGVFAVMVYYLFYFLKGPDVSPSGGTPFDGLIDAALALQFAVPHSWLLLPSTRKQLCRVVPTPAYGVFFSLLTCASLLLTIAAWRPWGGVLWELQGTARTVMQAAFYGAWIALFYSLWLSGLGYQTGWTTWRPWTQGRPSPIREFKPHGAYLMLRHPVYLAFLGLIWFTPCMTWDRAVLTGVWTIYIFCGSSLKDRRLLYYLGDRYRAYQSAVPGFPGMIAGPLARVPWEPIGTKGSQSAAA